MTDTRAALGAHRRQQPCEVCGAWPKRDKHARSCPKAKRGRNNRSRGNAYERAVAAKLGGLRVGQYGGKSDVRTDGINVQVKCGSYFPERIWSWLADLPADGRLPAVVIGDAPGAGHKRRELICLDLDDFIDLMGGNEA